MNLGDERVLWDGRQKSIRANCRKAMNETAVNMERTIGHLISVLEKTYTRQGIDVSASFPVLERIDETMRARGQCRLYCAEDAKGRIYAANYVVFDERHCFGLANGGDPALRQSGAQALVEWRAIKDSGQHSQIYKFNGSVMKTVEPFMRGFGPQQVHKFRAVRSSSMVRLFQMLSSLRKDF